MALIKGQQPSKEKKKRVPESNRKLTKSRSFNQNGHTIKSSRHFGEIKPPRFETSLIQTALHSPSPVTRRKSRSRSHQNIPLPTHCSRTIDSTAVFELVICWACCCCCFNPVSTLPPPFFPPSLPSVTLGDNPRVTPPHISIVGAGSEAICDHHGACLRRCQRAYASRILGLRQCQHFLGCAGEL